MIEWSTCAYGIGDMVEGFRDVYVLCFVLSVRTTSRD